ncbi:MAG: hypothetical protein KA116_05410 [Proteobacteria bacterium]|nr:hypothetical protein [Pseudomonadota bacterium]
MKISTSLITLVFLFETKTSYSMGAWNPKSKSNTNASTQSSPSTSQPNVNPETASTPDFSDDSDESSVTPPNPDPIEIPQSEKPQVIKGWLEDYSLHIEDKIQKTYSSLLDIPSSKMNKMCPKWSSLNKADRAEFWTHLLYAVSIPESSTNRTLIYLEKSMKTDSVTGYQVRSEGLLQLSYQDVSSYSYKGGDISWTADRSMAIQDYESDAKYGNPNRSILNAYANLNLGIHIIYKQVFKYNTSLSLEDAMGKYWYVMRTSSTTEFNKVYTELKKRFGICF